MLTLLERKNSRESLVNMGGVSSDRGLIDKRALMVTRQMTNFKPRLESDWRMYRFTIT